MKLIQRIGYYLGGFSLGLVILAFFLNGKKTSCSYGPESRVIKNITLKHFNYTEEASKVITSKAIDTSDLRKIIKAGNVNFSKSDTRKEPCGIYNIESSLNNQDVAFLIENCDSIVTVQNISFK